MKNNKILSVLLAILILLSGANLFVGVSNTIKIRQLEEINREQFLTILYLNKYIRELENMDKVRRLRTGG